MMQTTNDHPAIASAVSSLKRRPDTLRLPLLFVAGLFMGCFLTQMNADRKLFKIVDQLRTCNPETTQSSINVAKAVVTLPEETSSSKKEDDEDGNGWKAINVFYGDKKGLGADPNAKSFSQVHQDQYVLKLIGNSGYFIDLAANHALKLSNTLLLERYDWNGLCIEPNPQYWYGLSHRKCTIVGALVGGPDMQEVDFRLHGVLGGIVGNDFDNKAKKGTVEKRYTANIVEVFERYNVPKTIDYMSLDVEGAESLVMLHFPFDKYQFKILTVERPKPDLKALLNKHGYIELKTISTFRETLWAHESTNLTKDSDKIVDWN